MGVMESEITVGKSIDAGSGETKGDAFWLGAAEVPSPTVDGLHYSPILPGGEPPLGIFH
jgi:hypothetical protein